MPGSRADAHVWQPAAQAWLFWCVSIALIPRRPAPECTCRLEREVLVTVPDAAARKSILQLLARQLPLDASVDLQR